MMAGNVFGTPVKNETLKNMAEYSGQTSSTITRKDQANIAMKRKAVEGKEAAARNFVKQLRDDFVKQRKDGYDFVSVMCLIYNAAGDVVKCCCIKPYEGCVWDSPIPIIIQNGQWGAFLYSSEIYTGCEAGVIYAGKNLLGEDIYWSTAFSVPKYKQRSAVSGDIQLPDCDVGLGNVEPIFANLVQQFSKEQLCASLEIVQGASLYPSIGGSKSAILETTLALPGSYAHE